MPTPPTTYRIATNPRPRPVPKIHRVPIRQSGNHYTKSVCGNDADSSCPTTLATYTHTSNKALLDALTLTDATTDVLPERLCTRCFTRPVIITYWADYHARHNTPNPELLDTAYTLTLAPRVAAAIAALLDGAPRHTLPTHDLTEAQDHFPPLLHTAWIQLHTP